MSLLVKALLLLWPFLRVAIFGNRNVKQVLLENKHIVVMHGCLVVVSICAFTLWFAYEDVKSDNSVLKYQLAQICPTPRDTFLTRQKELSDLLK